MIIDAHGHVGDFRWSPDDFRIPMTWERLIARLDDEGIDKAVFLPVYNASPELTPWGFFHSDRQFVRDQVMDAARYPDRIIPFGNIDPRWSGNRADTDFGPILDWFQEQGCRGMGEVCANIPFDDPRTINMFQQLGERGMPITVETCDMGWGLGFQDEPGAPRLERLLQETPQAVVIGHGPAFWAELAPITRPEEKRERSRTPITEEGVLAPLFRRYPNLYADLSAASGFNALSRDFEYGVRFVNEFQDRLLFGTDIISRDFERRDEEQRAIDQLLAELQDQGRLSQATWDSFQFHTGLMPQLDYLKMLRDTGRLSQFAFDKITYGNLSRLLGGI